MSLSGSELRGRTIVSLTPLPIEADSRTYKMAASFARAGSRSIVVEAEPSSPQRLLTFELVTVPGRPTRPEPAKPARGWRRAASILRSGYRLVAREMVAPWQALPRADLYYVHSHLQMPGVLLRRGLRGAPIVYDAHDFYPEFRYSGPDQSRFAKAVATMHAAEERTAVRIASEFVTVSEGVATLFERHYGRRPVVIRNSHDTRLDVPDGPPLRSRLGLGPKAFLLAMVGNSKPQIPSEPFVRALAELPESVHLAFVGRGHRERLVGLVNALGCTDRVHFENPVHPTAIVPLMTGADAAIVGLTPDGQSCYALPNKAFQGIAAGIPVLHAPELTELADLLGTASVAIDPRESDSIAKAVRTLVEDSSVLTKYVAASHQLGETVNWEHDETRLIAIVETALGRPAQPGNYN